MIFNFRVMALGLLVAALGAAQTQPTVVLEVDVENLVFYALDSVDQSRIASDPTRTSPPAALGFRTSISIGDIVAVNGTPAKGAYISRLWNLQLTPTPARGQAISDTTRAMAVDATMEILQPDGTHIGSIMSAGLAGGAPAPGSPRAFTGWNLAVTGGTGYFLGASGTSGVGVTPVPVRNASITEDPSQRRVHGGGTRRYVVSLIPMSRPTVTGVMHADLTPVTAARPARVGELLILAASGIGPANSGTDPGTPFPLEGVFATNTPLSVAIGGQTIEPVNKVAWPGQVDTYRVDVRVPDGTPTGMVSVRLTAAWVPGPEFQFPVQ